MMSAVALFGRVPASYHGTVVDAESKAPLEGAVVVVVWRRKPVFAMDGPQYFHNAREVLTDAGGRFSIDARPGIDWNPFTYVLTPPRIVIVKPGYGAFPFEQVSPRYGGRDDPEKELEYGARVELPRLATREDGPTVMDPAWLLIYPCRGDDGAGCVPPERIPNFMRVFRTR